MPAPTLAVPVGRSAFGERQGPNWIAVAFIVGFHAALLFALVKYDVIAMPKPKTKPLVVDLLMVPPDPPPAAPPEQEVAPPEPVAPAIVAPKAVVVTPAPAPMVVVTRDAPPPKAVIVAPAAPPAPTGPMSVDDLSSKMISAPPPRYPVESRRRKEQGTVFLSVLVGLDGSVTEIGISRSSGSARLDKAALEAVRRWRWSPTMRAGAAVMVRGIVDIPFVLQA
jgi:protein TonB